MGNFSTTQNDCTYDVPTSLNRGNSGRRRISLKKLSLPDITYFQRRSSSGSDRCSMRKPLCRVSRRRWQESTLVAVSGISKTVWPVKISESLFFPEFKLSCEIEENNIQILEEIGTGAYSKVYKIKFTDSKEDYALKALSKSKLIEEDSVNQVKEEALIQSSCGHHPFIARCRGFWQSRHYLFIVSEYMSGGELWHLLKENQTLPEELSRIYIAEIALALDFLHNAGVIYRDLKLENIVLDESGHARLVDFGLSKRLKYGTRTSTLCGTLQFIAPEVFEHSYGHAADWWSLGVVSCLLLTGQYPSFVQKRMIQMSADEVLNISPPPITTPEDSCSASAQDLFDRLLQPNPQQRLRSIYALKNIAFFKGFSFEDVLAKKISPNEEISKLKLQRNTIRNDVFQDFDQLPT